MILQRNREFWFIYGTLIQRIIIVTLPHMNSIPQTALKLRQDDTASNSNCSWVNGSISSLGKWWRSGISNKIWHCTALQCYVVIFDKWSVWGTCVEMKQAEEWMERPQRVHTSTTAYAGVAGLLVRPHSSPQKMNNHLDLPLIIVLKNL